MPGAIGITREQSLEERGVDLARQLTALAFSVPVDDLSASTRYSAPAALARQVAMYLVHVMLGVNLTVTGRLFGRHRSTVVHACHLIEDRRDNPQFDALVDVLERALKHLAFEPVILPQSKKRSERQGVFPPSGSAI